MLAITGMPSSEMRCSKTSRRRASLRPREPLRSADSAAPKSTVTPSGRSGTPMWPTRDPGAMPVTSATARSCAGEPYRRAPDGPTHTAIGIGASATRSSSASISSRPTMAPRVLTCRMSACAPCSSERVIASSMASMMIGSNSPLTCSTSTGPGAGSVLCAAAGAPNVADANDTPAAVASRPIASLRTGASGVRRSSAAAVRLPGDDRGGQGRGGEDHGNGSSGPRRRGRRPSCAGRRARRQAGPRGARRRVVVRADLGVGGARRVPPRPRLRPGGQAPVDVGGHRCGGHRGARDR